MCNGVKQKIFYNTKTTDASCAVGAGGEADPLHKPYYKRTLERIWMQI